MRIITPLILAALTAVLFTACGPAANSPANNANTNTNTNTAKPTAAAPTAEALLALEKQANGAYIKADSKVFEGMLSDKFVMVNNGQRIDKAGVTKMVAGVKCEVKDGWTVDEPQMSMIDADTYIIGYKTTMDGTCNDGPGGKVQKIPSPTRAATVWIRSGDKWQAVFHGEHPIFDPKNPPKQEAAPTPKKEEPKKDNTKKDDKTASNSNSGTTTAPAAPAKSANTDALVAVEKSGWEAWKAKDAKKLDGFIAKNIAIIAFGGVWMNDRAAVIKYWAEMPCENIKTVDVKDGFSTAISPTVEILTFKGVSDGTCYGQKNTTEDGVSIYVKEGDAWKLTAGL